jgi:hypothetical protein
MDIETIKYKSQILCHIFRKNIKSNGVRFLTPDSYTLQLGLLEHPARTVLKIHAHNKKIKYRVDTTQEFLYIEKGKVRVSIFNENWKKVASRILTTGDFVLHVAGGHGFKILKKCRMIEIKQGPYPGEKIAKIYPKF